MYVSMYVMQMRKTNREMNYLDRFIALFPPAVIGQSNYFGICFTTLK